MSDSQSQKVASADKAEEPVAAKDSDAKSKSDEREAAAKRREEEKAAKEQAEQDEADIEAFLSVHRGEKLVRGADGSLDHAAFVAKREADRAAGDGSDAA